MRKKKKVKKKNLPQKGNFFTGKIVLLIVVIVISSLIYSFFTKNQINDEYKLEMKNPPKEIEEILSTSTSSASYRVPILMYHYIEYVTDKNDTIRQSLNIVPHVFEEQIKTLIDNEYTFLTLSDISNIIDGRKKMPKKGIALTFDDGYRDFYTDAFPILKKHNAKATAYIISSFLNRPNYMFDSQVEEIVKSGIVEIGAHTMHHVYLKGTVSKTAEDEIEGSKMELEKKFGLSVKSFAYPYGAYDSEIAKIVENAGFKTSVSTVLGITINKQNRFFLYRIRPGYKTGEELIRYIEDKSFN